MNNICRFRPEAISIFRLTTDRNGKECPAVEAVMESDNFGFIRMMTGQCIMTRQFECGFICLRTGVGKENPFRKRMFYQLLRQYQRRFISKNIADMPERFTLDFQGRDQCRMTMAQRQYGNTTGEINIFSAVLIPHPASLTSDRNKISRCINWQHHFIISAARNRILFCHRSLPDLSTSENIITKYE